MSRLSKQLEGVKIRLWTQVEVAEVLKYKEQHYRGKGTRKKRGKQAK